MVTMFEAKIINTILDERGEIIGYRVADKKRILVSSSFSPGSSIKKIPRRMDTVNKKLNYSPICSNSVVWYRTSVIEDNKEGELEAIQNYFNAVDSRTKIKPGQLVIPRFSALPYFKEQAYDIEECIGAKLINSLKEHRYIADIKQYYEDLKDFTPKTWPGLDWIDEPGPYVLKGITNSRKARWLSHMYAPTLEDAKRIYWELINDPLMQDSGQDIVIRKYEKLYKYMDGIGGMPIGKEYRFFYYKETQLSGGYYWSNYINDLPAKPDINEVPKSWLDKLASIISKKTNFYVIDVAQKENGEWIVIELNDGSMSGLSENDPFILWKNLKEALDNN